MTIYLRVRVQTVYSDAESIGDDYDQNVVDQAKKLNNGTDQFVVVDTTDLDTGSYHLDADGQIDEFEVLTQEISTSFEDSTVTADGAGTNTDFTIDDNIRLDFTANVSADGLDAAELYGIFNESNNADIVNVDGDNDIITLNARGTFDANFTDIEAGEYEFETVATDTGVTDTATITVSDEEADRTINADSVERGNNAEVTVGVQNTDEAAVALGTADDGYHSTVNLTDIEGDETLDSSSHTTILRTALGVFRTRTLQTCKTEAVNVNDGSSENLPLPAHNWDLEVGEFDTSGEFQTSDRDSLTVTNRGELGGTSTATAPYGVDISDYEDYQEAVDEGLITDTDQIAENDSLILTVEDYGAAGAVEGLSASNPDLAGEGITITLTSTDDGPYSSETTWNSSESSLGVNLINDQATVTTGTLSSSLSLSQVPLSRLTTTTQRSR